MEPLKAKRIGDLSDGENYWRKGYLGQWTCSSDGNCFTIIGPYTLEPFNPDEIVLHYPEHDPSPEARRQVMAWTGFENVHM